MRARRVALGIFLSAAAVMTLAITLSRGISSAWERSLRGPFFGRVASPATNLSLSSSLLVPNRRSVLCVSQTNNLGGPVLTLRSLHGASFWSRVLSVSNEVRSLRDVELSSIRKTRTGYKVRFTCEWEMGKEAGIIYLGPDLSFRHFALSW